MKQAPQDYFDMKGSVDKSKKVKPTQVFGKSAAVPKKKPKKKPAKKRKPAPPGYHYMPNGKLMKDSDMKKKSGKKKY